MITQASNGGLVSIGGEGSSGNVSVINSNLTDVESQVRTLCEYPSTVLYIRRPLSTLMIVRA